MRLLHITQDGNIELTKDLIEIDIPPYAILSHIWENEEVTFNDVKSRNQQEQLAGYSKLALTARLAAKDGLEYFWVDACCIDKSDRKKLSESTKSMSRWYQKATVCYIYLSDVSINKARSNSRDSLSTLATKPQYEGSPDWTENFRRSQWFRRGWTSQDLLVPNSTEVFSVEGARLGKKRVLERYIRSAIGISRQSPLCPALSSSVPKEQPPASRKIPMVDKSYYDLGTFGLSTTDHMYSEASRDAFIRLKEKIKSRAKEEAHPLRHDELFLRSRTYTSRAVNFLGQIVATLPIVLYRSGNAKSPPGTLAYWLKQHQFAFRGFTQHVSMLSVLFDICAYSKSAVDPISRSGRRD
jgi:hypothetical protein